MFEWLKRFLEWPEEGISNISELGSYVKTKWLNLIIFLAVLIAIIWVLIMLIKLIKNLLK